MAKTNDVRRAHKLLDYVSQGRAVLDDELKLLRSFLPELPKQKTLEEIAWDMDSAWAETSGNDWKAELFGDLETWLSEQHNQLRAHLEGVKSQAHPALPDGMRIAEHENFGRVVVSPSDDESNDAFRIFYVDEAYVTDSFSRYVETSSLTFIDAEPAKPAHPEFLETEADYKNAPEGTVVSEDGSSTPRVRNFGWPVHMTLTRRRVLRWGWGK